MVPVERQNLFALSRPFKVAGLLLLASCVPPAPQSAEPPIAPDPPAQMTANRTWITYEGGYGFRAGYFSEAEMNHPAWEEGRQLLRRMAVSCHGPDKLARRDVRWFPATEQSGQKCAAVVYSYTCDGGPDPAEAETTHRDLLDKAPDEPIERDCGNKDAEFHSRQARAKIELERALKAAKAPPQSPKPSYPIPGRPFRPLSEEQRDACLANGGRVSVAGLSGTEICIRPMPDAGKICTDHSQCEGGCYLGPRPPGSKPIQPDDEVQGICAATNPPPSCRREVIGGRAPYPALCVD